MNRKRARRPKLLPRNYRHPDRFGNWLGYRVVKADYRRHRVETALVIREDHLSPAGRVHGGVVSALFDISCGAVVFTTLGPEDFCSTVEIKVNYLRPLELGDKLKVVSKVVFRGKRLCVVQAELFRNRDREPAGIATATFNVITKQ